MKKFLFFFFYFIILTPPSYSQIEYDLISNIPEKIILIPEGYNCDNTRGCLDYKIDLINKNILYKYEDIYYNEKIDIEPTVIIGSFLNAKAKEYLLILYYEDERYTGGGTGYQHSIIYFFNENKKTIVGPSFVEGKFHDINIYDFNGDGIDEIMCKTSWGFQGFGHEYLCIYGNDLFFNESKIVIGLEQYRYDEPLNEFKELYSSYRYNMDSLIVNYRIHKKIGSYTENQYQTNIINSEHRTNIYIFKEGFFELQPNLNNVDFHDSEWFEE